MVLELQAKIAHQTDYINQLIEAIQLAKHQQFGIRSEKFDPESDQLSLLFNEAEALVDYESKQADADQDAAGDRAQTKVSGYTRTRRKGGRKKLPDHFSRIEEVHELDESQCRCDYCQGQLKQMGQKISEQIELEPLTVEVIKRIKKTYHCPHCKRGIKAAKLPAQPIPGSIATSGTLAHIAVNKYINGMPLY